MPKPTRIGIAIVECAGQFLVGERRADGPLAGYAEFPGGKCLPDEPPHETARRECREETGLDVTPLELIEERIFTYAHGEVHLFFCRCTLESQSEALPSPLNGFRWVDRSELKTLKFPEANQSVLAKLR